MDDWPPDYTQTFMERQERILKIQRDPYLLYGAQKYYADNPKCFINDWCITYDPRNVAYDLPTKLPFILFEKQDEFIDFLSSCDEDQEHGLIEKSRDMGVTWLCCSFSIYKWLFVPGFSIGWGSRKELLVDKLGDPDSIFEKMRMVLDHLPRFFWPRGFNLKKHATYMRLINPENGATITGESGDNIGRGGRKSIYFKDESAHYERPEKIEAALADNTNVQIDISSVHGTANIFARRREAGEVWERNKKIPSGITRVFIFDWRDHPNKSQQWYDKRRVKAESEGLLHVFAQEVDRDYSAAVEGVVIPAKWVKAAVDSHIKLGFNGDGMNISSLDVADEGGDKNAFITRKGSIFQYAESWGEGDTGQTTRKSVMLMNQYESKQLQYDSIGVGAGVKAEANRLKDDDILKGITFVSWNAAKSPLHKERRVIIGDRTMPKNKDFYKNLKAQAWWQARLRFERTYNAVVHGIEYESEELVSIPFELNERHDLEKELSQATYKIDPKGKMVIEKKPQGTKSPNLADAAVICLWPVPQKRVMI